MMHMRQASLGMDRLFLDEVTSDNATYQGPAERAEFVFSTGPEQLDFVVGFLRDRLLSEMRAAVTEQGATLLRLTVYRDTAPTWKTPYRCLVTAGVPASLSRGAATLRAIPWAAIILVALAAIIAWVVVKPILKAVTELWYGPSNGGGGLPLGSAILPIILVIGAIVLIPQLRTKR